MAIEAIAYEKLRLYAPRLPAAVLDKWQPPQAVRALLQFEPKATANHRLRFAREDSDGKPTGEWHDLGEHRSFALPWLRRAYNKLGSMLHIPSPKQAAGTGHPSEVAKKTREGLVALLSEVEHVAESRMDSSIATTITFSCAVCDSTIICNEEGARSTGRAICLQDACAAEHAAVFAVDGAVTFHLIATEFDCMGCKAPVVVENRKLAIGLRFKCEKCGAAHILAETQWGYGLDAEVDAPGA